MSVVLFLLISAFIIVISCVCSFLSITGYELVFCIFICVFCEYDISLLYLWCDGAFYTKISEPLASAPRSRINQTANFMFTRKLHVVFL